MLLFQHEALQYPTTWPDPLIVITGDDHRASPDHQG